MKMKLTRADTTALISCCIASSSHGGVVIDGSYGIAPGKGKPVVSGGAATDLAAVGNGPILDLQSPPGGATLATGFTLSGLIGQLPNDQITSGVFNKYTFTVGACIDSFVSSVLFEESIVGLKFSPTLSAGLGLFVLGVEGNRLTFAGYAPFSNGFTFDIYTADTSALPATATPEPSTLLVWGGLVALCGATRSLRRLL